MSQVPEFPSFVYMGTTIICVPVGTIIREDPLPFPFNFRAPQEYVVDEGTFVFSGDAVYCEEVGFAAFKLKTEEDRRP